MFLPSTGLQSHWKVLDFSPVASPCPLNVTCHTSLTAVCASKENSNGLTFAGQIPKDIHIFAASL